MQRIGESALLWQRLAPGAIADEIGGLPIKVVGYENLVALTRAGGRPEDPIDLERLRQARSE
jgi:hypothetical protein